MSRILDFFGLERKTPVVNAVEVNVVEKPATPPPPSAEYVGRIYSVRFDGEKNLGEGGPILDYGIDHYRLAARSWQAYLDDTVAQTIINRFTIWVMDKGLKLQSNPLKVALESEGITIDSEKFNEITEARFTVWAKSKHSTLSKNRSMNKLAIQAFKHAKIGGDCLVVLRYDKGVKVQIIDTAHLNSPIGYQVEAGRKVIDGVEIDIFTGEHVAYHVRKKDRISTQRIPAYSSTGFKTAFLIYGSEYRMDNQRGVPVIATSLERIKKLDRYSEATLGSAEERQKIAYSIEHQIGGTGESPLTQSLAKAYDLESNDGSELPVDYIGRQLANDVSASTNKQTFNMPIGATMKSLESKNELYFKDFWESNSNIICAAVGIPPNVAFSLYNDSFSASRAATKDWEHTIEVERDSFIEQFYAPIYQFWLFFEVLNGKINAPGYLNAWKEENWFSLEAYSNARFTGPLFPHIDPLKEVKAEREKLGTLAAHIPLTTVEAATEFLMSGDSDSNAYQFAEELKQAKELGLEAVEKMVPENNGNTDGNN